MKNIFIINPSAGKGREVKYLIEAIQKYMSDAIIYELNARDDASEVVKSYISDELMCIYACGGDGTINRVLNGIVNKDNVYLGIIPIGTGNDFIKSLPYSKDEMIDINSYQNPLIQPCDIFSINQCYFGINTVSAGLDVTIAKNVDKFKGIHFKETTIPYYMSLLYSLGSGLNNYYKIFIDDKLIHNDNYTFVVCGNGGYYGGGYHPTPDSKVDDGILDMCLIKKVTRTKILSVAKSYKEGTHVRFKDIVSIYKGHTLKIIADKNVPLNIDGEVIEFKNPKIEIIHHGIKLCLPNMK